MKFTLLILFLIGYGFSQNSITIKRGNRIITKDGMENIEDAIKYYEKLHLAKPDSFLIMDDLAYLYLRSKNYNIAIQKYKSLIKKFPNKIEYLSINYSKCFEKIGKIDSAIVVINEAFKHCIYCSKLNIRLGNIYLSMEDYLKAYKQYEKVDTLIMADNYIYLNNYAFACMKLDTNLIRAERMAKHAISVNPEFYIYETLGDILVQMKKYNEALSAYNKVLEKFKMERVLNKVHTIKETLKHK